ncbi:amino acid adenylation domain-containing protein, partial [Gordonia sp. NPDC003424]
MLGTDSCVAFSNLWGNHPTTLNLIAFAAEAEPERTALMGPAGPVSFATLHAQVSATAQVFAAQGMDTEVAVTAAVTGLIAAAGRAPGQVAAVMQETVAQLRHSALEVVGSHDLGSLPGIFAAVVAHNLDRPAVTDDRGETLNYGELDERSTALARSLVAAGAGPETLIGVALPRTVDLIVAIVGILKSGAAYLPLDLSQPADRLTNIVTDAAPVLVIAENGQLSGVDSTGIPVVDLGDLPPTDRAIELPPVHDGRLRAYIIATSGSTGRPKGVEITHRDVVALMAAAARDMELRSDDVWTMFHSYAFDFSVWELWGALLTGGRLVVVDRATTRDPEAFLSLLVREQVTMLSQTPSAFYQLIDARARGGVPLERLRYLVLGGEALSFDQVRRWYANNPADTSRLVNMYGITETTVHVTFRPLDPASVGSDASLIGRPLSSLQMHILDSRLRPVVDGAIGEIYVGGDQLARGYLHQPTLTSTRFVADPFATGSRLYRTGDLARRLGDDIEYLGRGDAQVQLRGFRIEYGEVEGALLSADGVLAAAAVVKHRDGFVDQLVGYVVANPGEGDAVDLADVKRAVAARVPDYMVPDVILRVRRLPLNVNGKLDRQALPDPVNPESRKVWRDVLAPLSAPTLVTGGLQLSRTPDAGTRTAVRPLDAALCADLETAAAERSVSPSTFVQLAWAVLVSRLTAQQVVAFGDTRPSRQDGGSVQESLAVVDSPESTMPVIVDVDPSATVADILTQIRDTAAKVDGVGHPGSEELATLTGLPTLFDTAIEFRRSSDVAADRGVHAVQLTVALSGAVPTLAIEDATAQFDDTELSTFAVVIERILAAAMAAPSTRIGDIELVGAAEAAELLPVTGGDGHEPQSLATLFGNAARRWPDRVAVVDDTGARLTYAELDERSNALARRLIADGVAAESLVAVAIGRSVELLTAIWAIAKTGAGYVPVDPEYGAERGSFMITDAGVRRGLTMSGVELPPGDVDWLMLDDPALLDSLDGYGTAAIAGTELRTPVRPHNVAYVIYTSGSTGRPKGVAVTHTGLANFAREESAWLAAEGQPVVLGFASPSFDASLLEYLLATVNGGTLAYRSAAAVCGEALEDFMRLHRVTHTFLTPTVLSTLDPVRLPDLGTLAAGGETVPQVLVDAWAEHTHMHNVYGPTETTIVVTIGAPMTPGRPVRMGGPIAGVGHQILDAALRPVPVGVPGELYVSGCALSRGYHRRPGLTAHRFIADPHGGVGARMYRTGDMVRWRRDPSGELVMEYVGRSDDQVKLRGLRIELGEIESVLAAHPAVTSSVVVGVGGSVATALAGYVVTSAPIDTTELRDFARRRLPSYMVPASITVLDALPLTPVGKLDKRALPAPVIEAGEYVAPDGPTEAAIANVFGEVLDVHHIGATESFFDLGGNSLSATRLVLRVAEELGVELSVRDLFETPTVRGLAVTAAGRGAARKPIVAVTPRPERVPLSFAQQRMWFINRFDPTAATYNIPVALRLTGHLDLDALRSAMADVVVRHEVLRTTFPSVDGVAWQQVHPIDTLAERLDWRSVDSAAAFAAAVTAGFDLAVEWPIRAVSWSQAPDECTFAVVAHHIAADGESMLPLVTDVLTAYSARVRGRSPEFAALAVQFADFAIWQHEVLGDPADAQSPVGVQLAYWTDRLAGLPDVLELPSDRARPKTASHAGSQVTFEIPAEIADRVAALAASREMTPFMVVHAVLSVLLARLSASDDIAIGTPVAGRGQSILEPVVGMFVNTLVLRAQVGPGVVFDDLLDAVRTTDLDALAHADVPFEAVVDALDPVRSAAFAPLAQVVLSFDPAASALRSELSVEGLTAALLDPPVLPAQFDMTWEIGSASAGEAWTATIIFATDLFDAPTVSGFADRFVRLLDTLTADPRSCVGDAPVLTADERARLTRVQPPITDTIHAGRSLVSLFDDASATHADRSAVTALDVTLTYAELDARSNAVAAGLRARGVLVGDLVGVATGRSVDLVVAILGVLKTGAGYLPLDLGNPVERLAFIVDDAKATVVISDHETSSHALWTTLGDTTERVDIAELAGADGVQMPPVSVPADSRAYVIYTSGSTGRPKGVAVTHRDVVTLMDAAGDDFEFRADDVWTMFHSYAFDFSVWELWGPLLSGGRLVVVDRDVARDPSAFLGLLADEGVTVLNQTPSAFYQLIEARRRTPIALPLRYVVFGGEQLNFGQVARWFDEFGDDTAELVNMYGITETTVHVSYRSLERPSARSADASFIGRALSSLTIHVLDARLHPVPDGVVGEMYVAGGQLAQGYLGRLGLTATRFVADPWGPPGTRMYRTGDLARRVDGDIEYLGRGDAQVQLRGFRIEYGEVEAALLRADDVVAAAARVVDVGGRGEQLIGYVVPAPDADIDGVQVREAVGRFVPGYMVPDQVLSVDTLPLTANGKLDRGRLPLPELGPDAACVAPASDDEIAVAAVFADVIGVDHVSVVTSFFDLGGNSLSATRVAARTADVLDVDVSVRDLFDTPSVRELTAALSKRGRTRAALRAMVRPDRLPLSTAQARMWFINQFDTDSAAYNIPMAVRLTGQIDLDVLGDALRDVIERHEVLRTVYPADADGPHQVILDPVRAREAFDWATVESIDALHAAVRAGFDVSRELPIRGRVQRTAADTLHLVLIAHHIAFDGASVRVLLRDLLAAYQHRSAGGEVPAPMRVQYGDYTLWQREVLGDASEANSPIAAQTRYWRTRLADLPAVTDLPMDHARPAVLDTAGAEVSIAVDNELVEGVERVARDHNVTVFMVGHAALAITVARLAGTRDVVIGSPIVGRTDAALDDLVGMFVNTLVLRTAVDPAAPIADFLADVRAADLDAFAHADVAFDDLIEELAPERSTSHQPLVQIAFSHTSAEEAANNLVRLDLPGLVVETLTTPDPVAKFDLTVGLTDRSPDSPMTAHFLYATALFDEVTVRAFAEQWLRVVRALVATPQLPLGDIEFAAADLETVGQVSRNSTGGREPASDGGVTIARPLVDVLAARTLEPSHPALICGDTTLDYAEFTARANRVARGLIARGVRPDDVVAVGLERSIDSVVAVFGVIGSGAAYLPVDPTYPQDRIAYMLADSRARLGITNGETAGRLGDSDCEWLDIAELTAADLPDTPVTAGDRNGQVGLDHLAYLVYTSGSTGRPKAVGVTNRGMANFVAQFREISGDPTDAPDTRVLHVASPSFDASVLEMMWGIGLGHTLVIAPASDYAGDALGRIIEDHRVTDTMITPTVLATVDPACGDGVRNLATGGEACSSELVARWARPGRRMFNFYGPSEATVWSLTGRPEPGRPVTIGGPVRGFAVHVLDARLHRVPRGVVGELYLAAENSLARGYLRRAGLTAAAFVADPYSPIGGARMYATGDLVRITDRGEIEFAGRADDQVKINGQRVELGEIESVLADDPSVGIAVVMGAHDTSGRTRLVAYLVAASGKNIDPASVLTAAGTRLARHMVPQHAVVIGSLPLTPGGKLDRRALPVPSFDAETAGYAAPETSDEESLAAIVGGLLGLPRVSVTESFFALGGDSIMSIQLASAARAAGLELSPREIFEHKTVRALARVAAEGGRRLPLLSDPPEGPAVLPPIVSWMTGQAASGTDFADFNQALVLSVPAEMTADDLGDLLATVVAAHPMLSARLTGAAGAWELQVGAEFDRMGAVTELHTDAQSGTPEFDDAVLAAHRVAARRLDPAAGRLVQAVLLDGADTRQLVLTIHHLAVDAVSWPILVEDLVTAWVQKTSGQPVQVRPEVTSAQAWTVALEGRIDERSSESAFWLARSPQRPTPLARDTDGERYRHRAMSVVTHRIGSTQTQALLTDVPEAFGGHVNDGLLGTLARAVRSWQEARGIVDDRAVSVLLESHGRQEEALASGEDPRRADLSRTVGWFTSVAPMLLEPGPDSVHAVKAAKEERRAQPDGGIGYGLLRMRADTEISSRPMPSIAFNYLGGRGAAEGPASDNAGPGLLPVPGAPTLPAIVDGDLPAMTPLTINASVAAGPDGPALTAEFRYPPELLSEAEVDDLAHRWSDELTALVSVVGSAGDVGLSPSDVPGVDVGQDDLDALADRYPGADVWPLAPLQRGLYFQAELGGDEVVDVYVTQAVLRLATGVDLDRLRAAVDGLVAHHRVLRSAFVRTAGGSVVTVVPQTVAVPWELIDLGGLGPDEVRARLERICREQKTQPFDLTRPPLMRVVAAVHDDGVAVVVTTHHILFDGWSAPLVLADLLAVYATGATYTGRLNPSGRDFKDFVQGLPRDDVAGLEAWARALSAVEGPTLVAPGAQPSPDAMPTEHVVELDRSLVAALEAVATRNGATVATALQLMWAVFLSRLTGIRTVSFGETVSGRPADLDGVESMVGLFINTLPVIVDVDPSASVDDLLAALQHDKVGLLDHQHLGMPEILGYAGRHELFDTLTIHESYPVNSASVSSAADGLSDALDIVGLELTDATHYPLNLFTGPKDGAIELKLKYLPSAFSDEQIRVFGDVIVEIARSMCLRPEMPVGDLELVSSTAAAAMAAAEAGVVRVLPPVLSVSEAVHAQIAATPHALALIAGDREVTYAEFGARVNALARELIGLGVGPDVAVAVCLPRSVEMLVAIHAVITAGGQYVPIDTGAPGERAQYMLDTAQARLLLVGDPSTVTDIVFAAASTGVRVLRVDASADVDIATPRVTDAERLGQIRPDSAIYTIFTSGSTGRPKGVTLPQEAVLNRLWWGLEELPIDATDRVMLKTPYTFDCSVPELFAPLMVGATTVVLADGAHTDPRQVIDELTRTGVTMVHFVPSMLSVFLEIAGEARVRELEALRIVSTTGEALPPAVAADLRRWLPHVLFYNLYGPTEAAVEITFENIGSVDERDPSVPIGVPVWNSTAVVLDARLHRVPAGVPGELYVGGVQLARGYAARPDLTAERFIADPLGAPGARLYRTGDLVRRLPTGHLEYLGRTDFQVKLRGQRIELGEIESVLASAPGVVHAAATVVTAPGGGEHLVGYVAGVSGENLDLDAVKRVIASSLPTYMVPSVWMVLDDIALNTAGKLDRRALPAPEFGHLGADHVDPETDTERELAAIFADVLGVERVSVVDSFFDAGGNSLSAMRVVARVSQAFGVDVSVRDLFGAPSVRELLTVLAEAERSGRSAITAVTPRPDRIPLSFAQLRMWYINQLDTTSPAYNLPLVLRLSGDLDVDALHAAIIDVIARHEILRTTFPTDDGVPRQVVASVTAVAARLDWAIVDSMADVERAVSLGFDVTRQLPLRVRVWEAVPREFVLAIVIHHIASDGESTGPLVADLVTAYTARRDSIDPEFSPLAIQFADYALWQHRVLGAPDDPDSIVGGQLGHWRDRLAGLPELLDLPTDRPRPAVASGRGAQVNFAVSAATGARIDELAATTATTPFMIVHAALAALLARSSGATDIAVGTPVAGRGQSVLDPLVGMFVNTLILRTTVDGGERFTDLLDRAKVVDLDAFDNADVPFETVVEAVGAVRSKAFAPLSQVWLTFGQSLLPELAASGIAGDAGELSIAPIESPEVPAKVDLVFAVGRDPEGPWELSVIYATDLFDEATALSFAQRLGAILDAVVSEPGVIVGDIALGDAPLPAPVVAPESVAERAAAVIPESDALVSGGVGVVPVVLGDVLGGAVSRWGSRPAVVD